MHSKSLAWVHIGDLHLREKDDQNYPDLLEICSSLRENLAASVDFVFLPGDNADNGKPEQYALVQDALQGTGLPLHAIAGDHDMEQGSLDNFYAGLGGRRLPYTSVVNGHRCLFIDVVGSGKGGPDFCLEDPQVDWLEHQLFEATQENQTSIVYMHTYPADLVRNGDRLLELLRFYRVPLVNMGHTHYNEIANDGCTIYAAARSTGQIEEGAVGFALAALKDGNVSWRFKELARAWPFLLVTSPTDARLVTRPDQMVGDTLTVTALAWSKHGIAEACVNCGNGWIAMTPTDQPGEWSVTCQSQADTVCVRIRDEAGGTDEETVRVSRPGDRFPARAADGSDKDSLGPWPEKGILGTQLGPNRNGKIKW